MTRTVGRVAADMQHTHGKLVEQREKLERLSISGPSMPPAPVAQSEQQQQQQQQQQSEEHVEQEQEKGQDSQQENKAEGNEEKGEKDKIQPTLWSFMDLRSGLLGPCRQPGANSFRGRQGCRWAGPASWVTR